MISITGADNLHKIVVLNPKGGSGKTTLATNLASLFALRGPPPTLVDCDPQGFCLRWLAKRAADRPPVHGLDGSSGGVEIRHDRGVVIVDMPAAISQRQLRDCAHLADSLLLPVMPSEIDVHSAARFVAELLLDARLDRGEQKLAIVANRVRSKTRSYQMLMRFLTSLKIPMIATIRDSQNYVHAAAGGMGVCEMPAHKVASDLTSMRAILAWLDRRLAVTAKQREVGEQREVMVARAAYCYAEHRGFEGGDPLTDWLDAEREVDSILSSESD